MHTYTFVFRFDIAINQVAILHDSIVMLQCPNLRLASLTAVLLQWGQALRLALCDCVEFHCKRTNGVAKCLCSY